MFIATLIAAERLTKDDVFAVADLVEDAGMRAHAWSWIEEGSAADICCKALAHEGPRIRGAIEGRRPGVDMVVQREDGLRRRRLLVADMDSTMIEVECIDELADYAGIKAEIAAITERAMSGELDFATALRERVALLKGLDEAAIARCLDERVGITPGAIQLVRTMKREGARTVLVSGGFTAFADKVGEAIGFDAVVANELQVESGRLTGAVGLPIVGARAKRDALLDAAALAGIDPEESLAVGDGANDIPMLEAAGLGVAFSAKPAAAAAADARIEHNDLTALLYVQGYKKSEWEPG
ncbi:MAG TPA: phosphoserine phosphatase SerB [Allosphingosinicella sp.]|jgi:phosphoserine phosphatase